MKRSLIFKTQLFFSLYRRNPLFLTQQLLSGILNGVNPFIHLLFVQKIFFTFETGNPESFFHIFLYYVGYIAVYEVTGLITYKWGWFRSNPTSLKGLYEYYMTNFLQLDQNAVERIGTGKIISIIQKGVERWAIALDSLLWNIAIFITGLFFTLWYIFSYSFSLGFIILFIYIIVFLIVHIMNSYMILYRNHRKNHEDLLTKQLVKMIMSKIEILQSGKIQKENSMIDYHVNRQMFYNLKMAPYFHGIFRIPLFGIIICKVLILFYFSSLVFDGAISLSQVVVIFTMVTLLEANIGHLIIFFKDFTKEFVTIERLWDFFDTTPQISGYETGNIFSYQAGNIELKNINYAYEGNKNVFENFDLKINGGKITAFVGPSGGGKSTLIKLIAGYLKANSGDIHIDGQKLSQTSLKSYYQDIGYLTQEPSVFDGTVRENLMYAITDQKIDGTQLQNILRLSKCEFIYDFSHGLDTEIGERGVKLSGGQKQRLAIAKIFLKNPKIIILDEPTSALDSQSEKAITEAMHQLFQNRTVLVIAHRLQTVKHADEIIVIDAGKIIERGTHQSLVAKKGYYAEMLELQSGF